MVATNCACYTIYMYTPGVECQVQVLIDGDYDHLGQIMLDKNEHIFKNSLPSGALTWGFPQMGVPQKLDVLSGKILLKWMIWGYHYFRKPPHVDDPNHDSHLAP